MRIVDRAKNHCLALFDELGAGTDPIEGAALATTILESLREKGVRIAATTHYSELKLYALATPGVENASCEFDVTTLSPTYRLLVGVPGKSNAFAISKRLGLPESIIARSRAMLSEENVQFEDILGSIERNRQETEEASFKTQKMQQEIADLKRQLEQEKEKIEKQKDKIYDRAREKADKMIQRAEEETNALLAQVKAARKQRDEAEVLRAMEEVKRELGLKKKKNKAPQSRAPQVKKSNLTAKNLKLGAAVLLNDIGDKGSVLSINPKDNTATIQDGIMKINSRIENLTLIEDEGQTRPDAYTPPRRKQSTLRSGNVKTEIDLRGMMLEEALMETDKFLDESSMAGLGAVSIIHGKGTGVLRSGIQSMLRKHPQVKSFRLGKYGEGEDGVTIAELK